ncbi:MAG: 2-isopropylmalate synthase, partial [Niameybacter sp.]
MFEIDKKSNLLELPENRYQLKEVDEAVMFREFYPYEEIPKIAFNNVHVPINMPSEIWITDTTFRDG